MNTESHIKLMKELLNINKKYFIQYGPVLPKILDKLDGYIGVDKARSGKDHVSYKLARRSQKSIIIIDEFNPYISPSGMFILPKFDWRNGKISLGSAEMTQSRVNKYIKDYIDHIFNIPTISPIPMSNPNSINARNMAFIMKAYWRHDNIWISPYTYKFNSNITSYKSCIKQKEV